MHPFREPFPTSVFLRIVLRLYYLCIFLAARWVDPALGFAVCFRYSFRYPFDPFHLRSVG